MFALQIDHSDRSAQKQAKSHDTVARGMWQLRLFVKPARRNQVCARLPSNQFLLFIDSPIITNMSIRFFGTRNTRSSVKNEEELCQG